MPRLSATHFFRQAPGTPSGASTEATTLIQGNKNVRGGLIRILAKKDAVCVIERTDPTAISGHIIGLTVPPNECAVGGGSQSEHLPGNQLMNRNQIKGRAKAAKGKIKQVAGKATGDKSTEYTGKAEKYGGKVEAGYGDLKSDAEKATK